MWITRLCRPSGASEGELKDINRLLTQLSERARKVTGADLLRLTATSVLVVAIDEERDNRIVGMATLLSVHKLMNDEGLVEDVVVDEAYRGRGLARDLMQALEVWARHLNLSRLLLTSRPSREAANKLYQSLGYELRETNVYQLVLPSV